MAPNTPTITQSPSLLSLPSVQSSNSQETPPYKADAEDYISLDQTRSHHHAAGRRSTHGSSRKQCASNSSTSELEPLIGDATSQQDHPKGGQKTPRGRPTLRPTGVLSPSSTFRESSGKATERKIGRYQPQARLPHRYETPAIIQLRRASGQVHAQQGLGEVSRRSLSRLFRLLSSTVMRTFSNSVDHSEAIKPLKKPSAVMAALAIVPRSLMLGGSTERSDSLIVHPDSGLLSPSHTWSQNLPEGYADQTTTTETIPPMSMMGRRNTSLPAEFSWLGSRYEVIWHDHIEGSSSGGSGSSRMSSLASSTKRNSPRSRGQSTVTHSPREGANAIAGTPASHSIRSRRGTGPFLRAGTWQIPPCEPAPPAITLIQGTVVDPIVLPLATEFGSSFGHWEWDNTDAMVEPSRVRGMKTAFSFISPTIVGDRSPGHHSSQHTMGKASPSENPGTRAGSVPPTPSPPRLDSFPSLLPRLATSDWISPQPALRSASVPALRLRTEDENGRSRAISLISSAGPKSPLVQRLEELAEGTDDTRIMEPSSSRHGDGDYLTSQSTQSMPVTRLPSPSPTKTGLDPNIRRTSGGGTGSAIGRYQRQKRKRAAFVPIIETKDGKKVERRRLESEHLKSIKVIPFGVVRERQSWIGRVDSGSLTVPRRVTSGLDGSTDRERGRRRQRHPPSAQFPSRHLTANSDPTSIASTSSHDSRRSRTHRNRNVTPRAPSLLKVFDYSPVPRVLAQPEEPEPIVVPLLPPAARPRDPEQFLTLDEIRRRYRARHGVSAKDKDMDTMLAGAKIPARTRSPDRPDQLDQSASSARDSTGCHLHLHCLEHAGHEVPGYRLLYVKPSGQMIWIEQTSQLHALGLNGYDTTDSYKPYATLEVRRLLWASKRAKSPSNYRINSLRVDPSTPKNRQSDSSDSEAVTPTQEIEDAIASIGSEGRSDMRALGMLGFGSPLAEKRERMADLERQKRAKEKLGDPEPKESSPTPTGREDCRERQAPGELSRQAKQSVEEEEEDDIVPVTRFVVQEPADSTSALREVLIHMSP